MIHAHGRNEIPRIPSGAYTYAPFGIQNEVTPDMELTRNPAAGPVGHLPHREFPSSTPERFGRQGTLLEAVADEVGLIESSLGLCGESGFLGEVVEGVLVVARGGAQWGGQG
ncbi:MAG TPA: hypothetical protein VFO16_00335, partial [Pseudonocardiaceae bacterium]|nr:hypothetical protein [Pseudonocardiaceae bacterium]